METNIDWIPLAIGAAEVVFAGLLIPIFLKLGILLVEVKRLREEHREIKAHQMSQDKELKFFAENVGDDIKGIIREHGVHEVKQGVTEAKIDAIQSDIKLLVAVRLK